MDFSSLSETGLINELLSPVAQPSVPPSHLVSECHERSSAFVASALLDRRLAVARELLLRNLRRQMAAGPTMNSPAHVKDWLRLRCAGLEHEVFFVLYLDTQNRLIEVDELFRGSLTQTSVYPREVVKGSLARNAAAIVLSHNHPSGTPEPSSADQFLTQTMKNALALVDVRVIDHFLVAGEDVVSFAELGLI